MKKIGKNGSMPDYPDKEALLNCHRLIAPYLHRTPVMTSTTLNRLCGSELYFKCENFQKAGAFKIRGATHAILHLTEAEKKRGVVTHSSGNFAQALALAAGQQNIPAYIAMPVSAPKIKKEAVRGYGGIIVECDTDPLSREEAAREIRARTGATFIHPSNDMNVILGQGTAAIELLQDYPDLECLITPVGGGGLLAGSALAARYFARNCQVFGGEPFEADDAYRSLHSGKIESNKTSNTIADGLRTQLGDQNFPIIKNEVSEIIRVEEEEIVAAMRLIWERMKIIVEPSSAVALAAVWREPKLFKNKKTGIILSGGNVDIDHLLF